MAALRKEKRLTQQNVSERSGLDRSVIVALEKGRRTMTLYYAEKVAEAMGVKPGELLPPDASGHVGPVNPYALLAELLEAVDDLRDANRSLRKRVEALEKAASPRRRRSAQG